MLAVIMVIIIIPLWFIYITYLSPGHVLDRHQTITIAGFSCGRAAVGTDLV